MAGWLNVASLVLGLTAWFLPTYCIMRDKRKSNVNWVTYSMFSLSACGIALCFQLLYSYHLVTIEDIAAIYDTSGGVAFAGIVLLVVTLVLNALNVKVNRK